MAKQVVVIGGGVAGASAAYRLARDSVGVTLVDASHEGRATAAGAGIISYAGLGQGDDWRRFFQAATAYHRSLVADLDAMGEAEIGYRIVGELILAPGGDGEARLAELAGRLEEANADWQDPQIGAVNLLSPAEAQELFPLLDAELGGVHLTGVARLDGRSFRHALHRSVTRLGGRVVNGPAVLRRRPGGPAPLVELAGETLEPDSVIVAAGAWTQQALAPLGLSVPVEPQRGQILHLALPGTATEKFPVLSGYGSDYMVTFPPDRVVVGATRETGSGFDYRVTAGGVRELLVRALGVAPGLASATLAEIRVGFRPASPDGRPVLGAVAGHEGLYLATGFGPSGLTLAPYSGALVAAAASGVEAPDLGPVDDLLKPFSPARLRSTP